MALSACDPGHDSLIKGAKGTGTKQNTSLTNYSAVNVQGTVLQVGAVAPEGGTLEAVASRTHHSNNQVVRGVHIRDNLRVPHQHPLEVRNSHTDKACTQGLA